MRVKIAIRTLFLLVAYGCVPWLPGGQLCLANHIIADSTVQFIEGTVAPYNTMTGGDTLFLAGGHRDYLLIRNLHGTSENPLVIINYLGVVTINTDHHFGISIENSSYFRFTGSGLNDVFYGIRVEQVINGGAIGISKNCTDFEIDHLFLGPTPIGALYAKTDPDCSFSNTREKFTQNNSLIHDNFISGPGNEGLYIGNTKFFGIQINCNGRDTLVLPSLLKGVKVYNNIIRNSGWDGIQISSAAEDCEVYNNLIIGDSQTGTTSQMAGILIGGGSKCDCYNNYIADGKGSGIEIYGTGDSWIYNNIIENAGRSYKPADLQAMKYGIYVADVSTISGTFYKILFNNIINPKSDGIRFTSILTRNNLVASNVIINPGNFDFYENGHFNFKGIDSYIMVPDSNSDVVKTHNFFTRQYDSAGFSTGSQFPTATSPLIDSGYNENPDILTDFYGRPRLHGTNYDIGAAEFNPAYLHTEDINLARPFVPVIRPNPVKETFRAVLQFNAPEPVHVWIFDLAGQTICNQAQVVRGQGITEITVSMRHHLPGTYIYLIQTGKKSFSGRFIKS